ncbi:MAG: tryptophan synthase subunit alpha [Candidatus Altiarchaeota archaeon]
MKGRIAEKFRELEKKGEKTLIGFLTAGDPTEIQSLSYVDALVAGGVDIMEFGLPFSDPIADGPTIQKANQRSLRAGMNTDRYFSLIKKIEKKHPYLPKICMTYYNILLARGLPRFCADCAKSGIDGLIIPDLPVEEAGPLKNACRKNSLDLIFIAAPTTTKTRLKLVVKSSSGFLYIVSFLGVTGSSSKLSSKIKPLIREVRKINRAIPICVGFGISTAHHVNEVCRSEANGAIVGSAFIKLIEKNLGKRDKTKRDLERLTAILKKAAK